MLVKSLVILMFSLFAVSALGALPDESAESAESAPPIFVEQEDGSLVLESGTIAIEQTDGSLILARGLRFNHQLTREERATIWNEANEALKQKSLRGRIMRILLPFKK